ncbi:hypothetical protein BDR03DRAFT_941223, partial [Suillus americanus]
MEYWIELNSCYKSFLTAWENCYFFHAAHSKPDFLTDDMIKKARAFVTEKCYYQDPVLALKQVASAAGIALPHDDLEAIVFIMHERGTRWLKEQLDDSLSSHLKPADLHDDIVIAKCRVRDALIELQVSEDKAVNVAGMWCNQFQAVELQGRMIGHWSTSACPWLYDKQRDTIKEKGVVDFFNKANSWVDKVITQEQGMSVLSKLHNRIWLHTGNALIRPKTGANMTTQFGPGCHKPDAVLMDDTRPIDSIEWTDIISALEIKYRNTKSLMEEATNYMLEIGRLILTNQLNRRYFVGLLLLGADLFVCIYTHGGLSITTAIDIYRDTNDFLNCIAWFKHADLEFLGYDKSITRDDRGFKMALRGEAESAH